MTAAVADLEAREFLRKADPVLAQLIDARPDFRPRAWMDALPPLDEDAGFAAVDLGDLATGDELQQIHRPLAGLNLIRPNQ
jgi:hypothetical protein